MKRYGATKSTSTAQVSSNRYRSKFKSEVKHVDMKRKRCSHHTAGVMEGHGDGYSDKGHEASARFVRGL
jgi:hypothetical protein